MSLYADLFRDLGLSDAIHRAVWSGSEGRKGEGDLFSVHSPIDDQLLVQLGAASPAQYHEVVTKSGEAFEHWRRVPAPVRGQAIREIADALRTHKKALGRLVSIETGKILSEGEGEIQEAIDVADFAVGLSRQLCGQTMHSERPSHRMFEQWHPLGIVGVITAFNFPAAVWAWNAMIAAVCGDVLVWKPSERAPLTAIAMHRLSAQVMTRLGHPEVFSLVVGDGPALGEIMAGDRRIPLVSATGSCRMGRAVGARVAERLGRSLLELGGNNAVIVLDDANLEMAVRSLVFGSVGTAGQRCTTTRRLLVQRGIRERLVTRLVQAYQKVRIGNPLESGVLMGPLISKGAVSAYLEAVVRAEREGGLVRYGGKACAGKPGSCYVEPTIIEADHVLPVSMEETFAPILYVTPVRDLAEAIQINNKVDQGLSSALFTESLKSSEEFLSHWGSDCGIANVNLGTSGAEIGGAFGGEKDTGGGRESGSDSWKQYMRRQTNTVNFSDKLPLAQGVSFDVG